jgi:metal-responsive CopG/Arc/MetJ family transcriptional regulator
MAKKSKKTRPGARAKGMTQISISLPEGLVGKIDAMADAENRNRSNFIANTLQALATKTGV